MITREQLEKRLEELEASKAQALANLTQIQANISAHEGAIEDAKYWLEQMDAQTKVEIVPAKEAKK